MQVAAFHHWHRQSTAATVFCVNTTVFNSAENNLLNVLLRFSEKITVSHYSRRCCRGYQATNWDVSRGGLFFFFFDLLYRCTWSRRVFRKPIRWVTDTDKELWGVKTRGTFSLGKLRWTPFRLGLFAGWQLSMSSFRLRKRSAVASLEVFR